MKNDNYHDYLIDIEGIIDSVFNRQPLDSQPKYLAHIGATGGELLRKLHYAITKTTRGESLNLYPLTYIAIVLDESHQKRLKQDLEEYPHIVLVGDVTDPESIINKLIAAGVDDTNAMLPLLLLTDEANQPLVKYNQEDLLKFFQGWRAVVSEHGLMMLASHDSEKSEANLTADQFILQAGRSGLMPKAEFAKRYPMTYEVTQFTLNVFSPVHYIIRHPTIDDLQDLVSCEQATWDEHLQLQREELERRITEYHDDTLVIEESGTIIAVNYSQRISSIEDLKKTSFDALASLSNPHNSVVQLLALNVLPKYWQQGLGDQLLEFLLYWRSLDTSVSKVIGATRCKEFTLHEADSFDSYLNTKDEHGLPIDPIIRFHVQHGAKILGLLPNYRPLDVDNDGNGVLIEYDVKKRRFQDTPIGKTKTEQLISISVNNKQDIKRIVKNDIAQLLGEKKMQNYSPDTPLMDLGFDSLGLLELRTKLGSQLELDIPATFFFQYSTVNHIIDYFVDVILGAYKEWMYKIDWQETTNLEDVSTSAPGKCLIFVDHEALSQLLVQELQQRSQEVIVITPKSSLTEEFIIEIVQENDITGIIYTSSLAPEIQGTPTFSTLTNFHKSSCTGLLLLIRALGNAHIVKIPRIVVATYNIVSDECSEALADSPISGLCKSISGEHPELHCKHIAVDKKAGLESCTIQLVNEYLATDNENNIAYREGKRLVARWIREEIPRLPKPGFKHNTTFLITGGLSEVGLSVARWYINHGAEYLVLVDDHPLCQGWYSVPIITFLLSSICGFKL